MTRVSLDWDLQQCREAAGPGQSGELRVAMQKALLEASAPSPSQDRVLDVLLKSETSHNRQF